MAGTDFWAHQASLPGLRSVVDPNDLGGHKSAYIDCLHKTALARAARFRRGDAVLEFGCGIGRLVEWMAPMVRTVEGVDRSPEMIARAARSLASLPNVSLRSIDSPALPFADATFDKVTSVWVLQHILDADELRETVRELRRVTRPGGRLFFLDRVSVEKPDEAWMPSGVIVRRPPGFYEKLFVTCGLACEAARFVNDEGPILRSPRLNRRLQRGSLPRRIFPLLARLDLRLKPLGEPRGASDLLYVCSSSA